ncbi:MAG: NAD(P)-binding domain-containing protein [Kiritimatiellae bacterium]|nr:NAD(P)-binding domain-containing protein [Kiritimatiellia bacterium]
MSKAKIRLAFFGAGGKMGRGACKKLNATGEFDLRCVEIAEEGIAVLRELGLGVTPAEQAVADADVVVFALPDAEVLGIAAAIVPQVPAGALVMMLDPCAAFSGKLPKRDDIGYFVSHPCHHSFLEKRKPGQHIVTALYQGAETHYAQGVRIASIVYAPILDVHRLTVEQMILLEPVVSETVAGPCCAAIKAGYDEVVKRGVPEKAAFDFLLGHVTATLWVMFGFGGFFSDGAHKILKMGDGIMLKKDWKRAFSPESIREQIDLILTHTGGEQGAGEGVIGDESVDAAVIRGGIVAGAR